MKAFHTLCLITGHSKSQEEMDTGAQQIDFNLECVIRLDKEAHPVRLHIQEAQTELY